MSVLTIILMVHALEMSLAPPQGWPYPLPPLPPGFKSKSAGVAAIEEVVPFVVRPSMAQRQYDFFLCHRGTEKRAIAGPLFITLLRDGYRVFFDLDRDCVDEGDPIHKTIEEAINQSKHAIILVSPAFFDSKWCVQEAIAFLNGAVEKVVPIFVEVEPTHIPSLWVHPKSDNLRQQLGRTLKFGADIHELANSFSEHWRHILPNDRTYICSVWLVVRVVLWFVCFG